MLVELTAGFKERFGEAKREKNILDFTGLGSRSTRTVNSDRFSSSRAR